MKVVFDSEIELESFIEEYFNENGKIVIDDSTPQYLLRQINLGSYGIADLVSINLHTYSNGTTLAEINVYELKKEKITAEAFAQVSRYATAISICIKEYCGSCEIEIYCVLVGTQIDESCFILNNSEFRFYKAYFDPATGVKFKDCSEGWHRENKEITAITEIVNQEIIVPPVRL